MKVKEYIAQEEQNTPLQERLKLVRKIFILAMEINAKGKYYVFFDLQAHVSRIHVHITPQSDYKKWIYEYSYYYDCNFKTHEEIMNRLNEMVSVLLRCLRDSDD